MKAVVLSQPGSASVERLDDPAPAPDGIVVSPDGCGICRTDLHRPRLSRHPAASLPEHLWGA